MLTAIRTIDRQKRLARDAEKSEAPFFCPQCEQETILHKGKIKVHHFKHKPPVTCSWGRGETQEHYQAKLAIFDGLKSRSRVRDVELEKNFGTSIADVYAVINGTPVAVEIQRSNLSVSDITARTENYRRLGVYVLWVSLPKDSLWGDRYSPTAWEKWCHSAYFGRVFYWAGGDEFEIVHFDPYVSYVEEREWHDYYGSHVAGGYNRISRRYKTPRFGSPVYLGEDFRPLSRRSWAGGSVFVPDCLLYQSDKQTPWWSTHR
jgi:competence protein CoiA